MIIIEEDDEYQGDDSWMDRGEVLDEKLTVEEKAYRSAVSLMDSAECVVRYENRVKALRDAAALFEGLGGYLDSGEQAGKCRKWAERIERNGREKAYRKAAALCDEAGTELEYRTAISEMERVSGYRDSLERMEACRSAIVRLEEQTAWRNRMIVLLAVAFIVLAAWLVLTLL